MQLGVNWDLDHMNRSPTASPMILNIDVHACVSLAQDLSIVEMQVKFFYTLRINALDVVCL